jgi:hypothetical protein
LPRLALPRAFAAPAKTMLDPTGDHPIACAGQNLRHPGNHGAPEAIPQIFREISVL